MRVGISVPKLLPPNLAAVAPLVRQAIANIESAGFTDVWIPDVLNRGYTTLDPLVYAAAVGSMSEEVRVGTAVLQVGRQNAFELAHRVLTVASLCGGRFTLGAGMGSAKADFEAVGAKYEERHATFADNLRTLQALLQGELVRGVQLVPAGTSASPPIVIGAWRSPEWIERAAAEFDGWMGSTAKTTVANLRKCLDIYRRAGGRRAIAGNLYVDLTAPAAPLDEDEPLDLRCPPPQAAERLRLLEDIGFDEVTLTVFDHSPAQLELLRSLS